MEPPRAPRHAKARRRPASLPVPPRSELTCLRPDRNLVYMTNKRIALAEAKKRLSELVGRVAYGREQFIITRRGRAAAVLGPAASSVGQKDLADVKGWLPDDDPLFGYIEESRRRSRARGPRARRVS